MTAAARTESLAGILHQGPLALPVTISCASSISLFVKFSPPANVGDETEFDRLAVSVDCGRIELSRCRYHVEPDTGAAGGRLVFLDDIYDFHRLFGEGRVVDLKAHLHNLGLVMLQKEGIRPEFLAYTANTVYDFSCYKRFFNEQDRLYVGEPDHVRAAAHDVLLRSEGTRFFTFFDDSLKQLDGQVASFDKEEHARHGFYFRRHVWEFILASAFLARTNLKPRGYAGDSEMMRMVYENRAQGQSIFNKLMHRHPIESKAAQAVRNRRRLVPKAIREVQARFSSLPPRSFRFMSVACGPAWELRDLFVTREDFERYHCTLLDQDAHALGEAQAGITRIEVETGGRVSARYLNESVRTMLKSSELVQKWGRFHFLYSMGLFDYLTPPVARAVLLRFYQLLEPGGTMIVGNYHVANPSRAYMEYWMDWVLYYRTEEELLDLASALPGADASVSFEDTRCQMFLQINKSA